jgi:hypothetical protein
MRVRVDEPRQDGDVPEILDRSAVVRAYGRDNAAIDRDDTTGDWTAGDREHPGAAVTYHPEKVRRRTRTLLLAAVGIMVGATATSSWTRHAASVREASYQAALDTYKGALERGMTRAEVEAYLKRNRTEVHPKCCLIRDEGAWEDFIEIGQEPPPWYCSAHQVYIALAFRRTDGQKPSQPEAHETDVLTDITMLHLNEKCL